MTLQRHSNLYFQDFQEKLLASHVDQWFKTLEGTFQKAKNANDWKASVLYWNEIKAHIENHLERASLAFCRDTQNSASEAEEKRLRDEIEPPYKTHCASIRKQVLNSPFRAELEKEFSKKYFTELQLQEDSFAPRNIEMETEINNLLAEYTKITGSGEFEVRGQKYALSHYKVFSSSPDAALRQEAFQSYSGWFEKRQDKLDEIYDHTVKLRNRMGQELGHADYTLLGYQKMRRLDYGPADVEKFRKQIETILVPIATRIRDRQALSQNENTLKIWNSDYFPEWRVERLKVTIPEQIPTSLKVFETLSPVLGKHFKSMVDNQLLDLEARTGKAPGAFCTDFADYRVPFIFLNSVGDASDITTILHESGHAFQAWESRWIDLMELRWPTLEACEVHSMSMEFFAHPYYEDFFPEDDAKRFKKHHVADSLLLLPYIAMVDEFQHRVYSGEASNAITRAKAWEELENKYLPGLDFGSAKTWKKIRWMRQLHIFKHPFYYIDYAIALVGALQLWVQSIQNKEKALENYLNLCKLGGTLALKDFFKEGNLKLPFEEGMLEGLIDQVLKQEPLFN